MCKPKIRKMGLIVRTITGGWASAITISPFGIYVMEKYWEYPTFFWDQLVNHEKIHWKQQLEMGILPFYIWYLLEWFIKLFIYGKEAYYNISFERESNTNEDNLNYLTTRKTYSWIHYLKIKKQV